MKKSGIFAVATIALGCSVSVSATSYICVNNKDDVVIFSGKDAVEFSNLMYQGMKGEFLYLTSKQMTVRKNNDGLQIIGVLSDNAKFSGFSASFSKNIPREGTLTARIKFTDAVGMPMSSDVYQCSVEESQ